MRLKQRPTAKSLQVLVPRDLRPRIEKESASASLKYFVYLVLAAFGARRGSDISGDQHFEPQAWTQLTESLSRWVGSSRLFSRVGPQPGDYTLETEVLHLVANQYRLGNFWSVFGGSFASVRNFFPSGTVTLRLRLRTRGGRLVGERVVSGSYLGGPRYSQRNFGLVARRALINALIRARALVASWVVADVYRSATVEQMKAHYDKKGTFTFLVHRVNDDRTEVTFAEIEFPSGRVRGSQVAHGVPIVGSPGQWLVSPYDENGVRYPIAVYAALTRKIAERFIVHRLDQLDVYRYLGARAEATAPPASSQPATPPPPTPASP